MSKKSKSISESIGNIISFTHALKLIHWHITGVGSYEIHLSLDEAITNILALNDRLVETTYSYIDDLSITIPETPRPQQIIPFLEGFYELVHEDRELFTKTFTQSILDEYQETLRQLLYRVKRLQ